MPRKHILTHTLTALAAAATVIALGAGHAAEPAPAQPDMDPAKMQEAMNRWLETIKPGDKHKDFAKFVGTWDTTTRMFMAPGAPPMESKGSATFELIHGGRFIKQDFKGKMPMPGADGKMTELDLTGLGITGFDNNRKLYTMVWTDSLNTGLITGSGNLSQDGKTLTMFGAMDEPMTGEMGKTVRYVTREVDQDTFVFEISEVLYGDPFKVVEIEYRRRK